MPETSALEVRRIRISRRAIALAAAGAVAIVLVAIAGVAASLILFGQAGDAAALEAHNTALKAELLQLDDELNRVTQAVDRVGRFEKKLRSLTMISDPERNLAMGGGGPGEETDAPDDASLQLRRDLLGSAEAAARHASAKLELLATSARRAEARAEELSALLEGQRALLSQTPSRRPSRGYVTSGYGMRIDPFTGFAQMHAGIDFSARLGAPVNATADGVVIFAGKQGAYGKMIELDHGQGLVTKYGHLDQIHVKVGEKVKRGHTVGAVGNTGRSTGPHLHYEVRLNGIAQDPRRFMLE